MAADAYHLVHRFYVTQLRLLDAGAVDQWAATFTSDATFAQHGLPGRTYSGNAPATRRGREAIAAAASAAVTRRAGEAVIRRYWLGMLSVAHADDGTVRTRFRALNVETPAGGTPALHNSTTGEDVLVPFGDGFLVRERIVRHDNV